MATMIFDDDRGYDPYNHTGRLVRRRVQWSAIYEKLTGEVLILHPWQEDFLRTLQIVDGDSIRPKYFAWDIGLGKSTTAVIDDCRFVS